MARQIGITLAMLALLSSAYGDALFQVAGPGSTEQITLGNSSQAVTFTGTTTGADVTFTALSGPGLFGSDLGSYMMTLTSGPIQLAPSSPPIPGVYVVTPGSWVLSFSFTDTTDPGTFSGMWNLETLSGGTTRVPEFIGSLLVTSGTDQFQGWVGTTLLGDFTINLGHHPPVSQIFQVVGESTTGTVSSGELVPVPEPESLGLIGFGVLALAGFLRRNPM